MVLLAANGAILLLAVVAIMIHGATFPASVAFFKYVSAATLIGNGPTLHREVIRFVAE